MKRHGFSWLKAILLLAGLSVIVAVLFPVFARQRYPGKRGSCQSNLKQLGLGFLQYLQDYDERYPPVALNRKPDAKHPYGWADAIYQYTKSRQIYQCPSKDASGQDDPTQANYTDYWLNLHLFAQDTKKLDWISQTIMSGDGNDGSDLTDARYSLSALPPSWLKDTNSPAHRHLDTMNLLFADGHVKAFFPQKIVASPANGASFALKE